VSPSTVELLPELTFLRERPRQALGADLEWAVSTADLRRAFVDHPDLDRSVNGPLG
jgi:hypothetical protein